MHGRRALTEAYAMNKYIKMSEELSAALAEQERSEKERKNTRWNRFLRKTCVLHARRLFALFVCANKQAAHSIPPDYTTKMVRLHNSRIYRR